VGQATARRGAGCHLLADDGRSLVCRKRASDAPTATRREFLAALKAELPSALAHLQRGNIAPVDLAQSAIGPGMAVYTRYAKAKDTSAGGMVEAGILSSGKGKVRLLKPTELAADWNPATDARLASFCDAAFCSEGIRHGWPTCPSFQSLMVGDGRHHRWSGRIQSRSHRWFLHR